MTALGPRDNTLGERRGAAQNQIVAGEVERLKGGGVQRSESPYQANTRRESLQVAGSNIDRAPVVGHTLGVVGRGVQRSTRKHPREDLDHLLGSAGLIQIVVDKGNAQRSKIVRDGHTTSI